MLLPCLLAAVQAASEPVKKESNGIVVIYSWGKVCINMCEWDCSECLEWNEETGTPVENGDVELDELWLENDDGTTTHMKFPLMSEKCKAPKLDLPQHSRPSVTRVETEVEPEENDKCCAKWYYPCWGCDAKCTKWVSC